MARLPQSPAPAIAAIVACEALAAMAKIVQAEWLNPTEKGTARPMES